MKINLRVNIDSSGEIWLYHNILSTDVQYLTPLKKQLLNKSYSLSELKLESIDTFFENNLNVTKYESSCCNLYHNIIFNKLPDYCWPILFFCSLKIRNYQNR